ncbi:hypothetical protein BDD12DRAFT_889141 [Trichophaea hybrida]|nr:hypothetical protein BDD12DRAFT_889141 [Trichophaea hybrida]
MFAPVPIQLWSISQSNGDLIKIPDLYKAKSTGKGKKKGEKDHGRHRQNNASYTAVVIGESATGGSGKNGGGGNVDVI